MSKPVFQIHYKSGAVNALMHPRLAWGLYVLCEAIYDIAEVIPVVTSVWDQSHGEVSLHYIGCAADVRSKNLTKSQKQKVLLTVQDKLGDEFDLILEADGEPHEHFHLEWDAGKFDRRAAVQAAMGVDSGDQNA